MVTFLIMSILCSKAENKLDFPENLKSSRFCHLMCWDLRRAMFVFLRWCSHGFVHLASVCRKGGRVWFCWFCFSKASLVAFFGPLFPAVLTFLPCFFLLPSVFSRNGDRDTAGTPPRALQGWEEAAAFHVHVASAPFQANRQQERGKLRSFSNVDVSWVPSISAGWGIGKPVVSSLLLDKWVLLDISLSRSPFPTQSVARFSYFIWFLQAIV